MSRRIPAFDHVPPNRSGYSPRDVLAFLEGGRRPAFRAVKGGYSPEQVDAFLDVRADRATIEAARKHLAEVGGDAYDAEINEDINALLGRASRPAGQKFRAPSSRRAHAYSAAEVDALTERIAAFFSDPLAPGAVSVSELRNALFSPGPRGRAARTADRYEEGQVDAFLEDAARLVLLTRESLDSAQTRMIPAVPRRSRPRRAR